MQKLITFSILLGMSAIALAHNTTAIIQKIPIFPGTFDTAGKDTPAIKAGNYIFISGQGAGSIKNKRDIEGQIKEAFTKLEDIANASGGDLNDIVKITVYLADLSDYSTLNKVMSNSFKKPYPARSTVSVSMLPKDHRIEVDAIMLVKK